MQEYRVSTLGYKTTIGECGVCLRDSDSLSPRNVGFLRYWTWSNAPLFILAAPMLWLMLYSSATFGLRHSRQTPRESPMSKSGGSDEYFPSATRYGNFPQLALPQLVLAIAAVTSFHVQIINRISSGYPILYLTVAEWILEETKSRRKNARHSPSRILVRWAVLYSMIQGVLFANFLPPA